MNARKMAGRMRYVSERETSGVAGWSSIITSVQKHENMQSGQKTVSVLLWYFGYASTDQITGPYIMHHTHWCHQQLRLKHKSIRPILNQKRTTPYMPTLPHDKQLERSAIMQY